MKINLSEKQTEFWSRGYTIFDNLFPEELLKSWKWKVIDLSTYGQTHNTKGINYIHKVFKEENLAARDGIGEYKFTSIDGRMMDHFQGLAEYYHSTSNFLSILTGLDIVESWDKQSSISFMNYTAPGGCIAPHFDTNGITFLLYLTDNEDEGGTKVQPINTLRPTILGQPDEIIGEFEIIYPKFGRVVIFQSRKLWHESQPVYKKAKISSVWNFYERGDSWRPAEISDRLYK